MFHCLCSYVCILFAFISYFLKLVVYMLGYVPYITTGFTDFRKPAIIQWRKSVFGMLFIRTLNNVIWVHLSTSIVVKMLPPWLTLVASFLETPHMYNANVVGRKHCTCENGCHINGLIKSFIDQDDGYINVVADDTGIFAFLWLWYDRLFGKGKTTSVSTMIKWWGIGDVGLGAFGDDGTDISMVTTTRHKSISTLYSFSC